MTSHRKQRRDSGRKFEAVLRVTSRTGGHTRWHCTTCGKRDIDLGLRYCPRCSTDGWGKA